MPMFSDSAAQATEGSVQGRTAGRLRTVLRAGAVLWCLLLVVGFFAPGGWQWGLPGPVGHMENYVISLWFVALVLAPLLASRNPLGSTSAIQVYALGVLAVVASTFRGEPPKWISDAPPLALAALTLGLVIWVHPARSTLWRLGSPASIAGTH